MAAKTAVPRTALKSVQLHVETADLEWGVSIPGFRPEVLPFTPENSPVFAQR